MEFLHCHIEYELIWTAAITTTPDQSGPGSNGNETVHHTPHIYIIGDLPSDVVKCYTENTFELWGFTPPPGGYTQQILSPTDWVDKKVLVFIH